MTDAARTISSEEGFRRFMYILAAQDAWRGMTKVQRAAVNSGLCELYSPRTIAALERRGVVKDGRLTEWGEFVRVMNRPKDAS